MAEGFLPIATEAFLLPKLHQHRCVVRLPHDLHVSRSVRKKAKRYRLTINQDFEAVVRGCRQQHGSSHCWLYPPLVQAFQQIHACGCAGTSVRFQQSSTTTAQASSCPVRLYSIEIWTNNDDNNDEHDDVMVAGELGYTVGSMYTSLTGFSNQDSAGSVQLAALGKLLCSRGFEIWDLGMDMEYKRSLGSHLMPRDEFVDNVHRIRTTMDLVLPEWNLQAARNCRDIIDQVASESRKDNGTENT